MAIGFIQVNGGNASGGSSPRTFAVTIDATCSLLLLARAGSFALTSASINGQAFTAIDNSTFTNSMELWGIVSPPTGAQTITMNWSGGSDSYDFYAIQYSGTLLSSVAAACPDKTSSNGSGTLNPTLTTTKDNSWLVAVLASLTNSGTVSAGTGTTKRVGNGGALIMEGVFDSNAAETPTGSYSLQVTNAQNNSHLIMVSLAPQITVSTSVSDTITSTEAVTLRRGVVTTILNTITSTETIAKVIRGTTISILGVITASEVVSAVLKWAGVNRDTSTIVNQTTHTATWTDSTEHTSTVTNTSKSV